VLPIAVLPWLLVPVRRSLAEPSGNGSDTLRATYEHVAADLIRTIRRRSGLTQAEMAKRCGLARPALSAYENGRRQPSVATLARIAAACGAKVELTPSVDLFRNGAKFEDALSIVDAMPSGRHRRRTLPKPISWPA
jgi:transcriptional regulator with XRE-family HTH domain